MYRLFGKRPLDMFVSLVILVILSLGVMLIVLNFNEEPYEFKCWEVNFSNNETVEICE